MAKTKTGKALYDELSALLPTDDVLAPLLQEFNKAVAALSPEERSRYWVYYANKRIKDCTELLVVTRENVRLRGRVANQRDRDATVSA